MEGARAYADDSASAETQHAFQNTVEPGVLSTRTERHQVLLLVDPRHFRLEKLATALLHEAQHAAVISGGRLFETFGLMSFKKQFSCEDTNQPWGQGGYALQLK